MTRRAWMMLQPSTLAKEATSVTSTSDVSRNVHSAKIRSRFQHNEACQSFELLGGRPRINLHCTKAIKQMNFSSTSRTGLMSVSPQTADNGRVSNKNKIANYYITQSQC